MTSIPLVYPDNFYWEESSNSLLRIPDKNRTSLIVNPKALEFIESFSHQKVGAICIAGLLRTGKSYVLSRLMGSKNAFQLGNYFDSQTQGIWIGLQPISINGNLYFLLDTEGLCSVDSTQRDDDCIFALSALISSLLIFNTQNVPNAENFQKLQFITNLIQSIKLKENTTSKADEIKKFMPNFLWLLRDVTLKPTVERGNRQVECDILTYFLEKILKSSQEYDETRDDKIKKAVLTFFPVFDAFSLPLPSSDNRILQSMDNADDSLLNPDFVSGINRLIEKVKMYVKPISGFKNGTSLTASTYSSTIKEYVKMINDPKNVPTIKNAWENIKEISICKIADSLAHFYSSQLNEWDSQFPLEEKEIFKRHEELQQILVNNFLDETFHLSLSDLELNKYIQILNDRFAKFGENSPVVQSGLLKEFLFKNKQISAEYCKDLITKLSIPLKEKIESGNFDPDYSFEEVLNDLNKIESFYHSSAIGPAKEFILIEWRELVDGYSKHFTILKGYKEELLENEKQLKISEANERVLLQQKEMIVQQMELEKKAIEEREKSIRNHYEKERKLLIQNFESQQMEAANNTQQLMKAKFKEEAVRNENMMKMMNSNMESMLSAIDSSQKTTTQAMVELANAIAQRPPPIVNVEKSDDGGGFGIMDALNVAKEGLGVIGLAKSTCSVM